MQRLSRRAAVLERQELPLPDFLSRRQTAEPHFLAVALRVERGARSQARHVRRIDQERCTGIKQRPHPRIDALCILMITGAKGHRAFPQPGTVAGSQDFAAAGLAGFVCFGQVEGP